MKTKFSWMTFVALFAAATLGLNVSAEELASDEVGGSWYGMAYFGRMTDNRFHEVLRFHHLESGDADLYSGEIGYRLHDDNLLVEFADPVLSSINLGVNFTYQDDPSGAIYQVNPFIMLRWSDFPWNSVIRTTFAVAEGLSYSTHAPATERDSTDPDSQHKRLLNYVAVEVTFSLPKRKDWELVYRLHHRSGVFGLFDADNSGSTALGVGIRHYFK
jgi:hypothetical protein